LSAATRVNISDVEALQHVDGVQCYGTDGKPTQQSDILHEVWTRLDSELKVLRDTVMEGAIQAPTQHEKLARPTDAHSSAELPVAAELREGLIDNAGFDMLESTGTPHGVATQVKIDDDEVNQHAAHFQRYDTDGESDIRGGILAEIGKQSRCEFKVHHDVMMASATQAHDHHEK